jgi:hypothetical protein
MIPKNLQVKIKKAERDASNTLTVNNIVNSVAERILKENEDLFSIKNCELSNAKKKKIIKTILRAGLEIIFAEIYDSVVNKRIFVSVRHFGTFMPMLVKRLKDGTTVSVRMHFKQSKNPFRR